MEERIKDNILNSIVKVLSVEKEEVLKDLKSARNYLKQYLNQVKFSFYDIKRIDKEIASIERDIAILTAQAEYSSPSYNEHVDESKSNDSKVEISLMQIEEMQNDLKQKIYDKYLIKKGLEAQTKQLEEVANKVIANELHKRIFKEMYIDCERISIIADRHYLMYQTVVNIQDKNLKLIAKSLSEL